MAQTVKTCLTCGQTPHNQHSLKRAGICDGIKSGKLKPFMVSTSYVGAYDADGNKVEWGEGRTNNTPIEEIIEVTV